VSASTRTSGVIAGIGAQTRATVAVASIVAGLLLGAVFGASESLAAANLNWGVGVEATLPADAGTSPGVELNSLACSSPTSCTAVGRYRDTGTNRKGLLLTKTLGVWSAVGAVLPAGADTDPVATLDWVSCASAGDCTAVGTYRDTSGNTLGVLLTQTSGTWATGVEAPLPSGAGSNPQVTVSAVSCTAPGDCSAVGEYTDSSGHAQGLLLTETSGTWSTGVEAQLPAAATNPGVVLTSVSCVSAGNCTAVGVYKDASGNTQGLLLTQSSGAWQTGVKASLPASATNPNVILRSVVCPSAGNCTVVGQYDDASSNTQGLLLSESSGTWATGAAAILPAGAGANPAVYLQQVSCTAPGDCAAVGGYSDTANNFQGLLLTETAGSWNPGLKAGLPPDAAANPFVSPLSVSCFSAGNCAAVGYYDDGSGRQGLLLSETNGTWAPSAKASLPANGATDPQVILSSVSCTSVSTCTTVGRYSDTSANVDGVVFDAAKASPKLAALAPSTGTVGRALPASAISATLSLGATPVGAIQFRVFGPQASPPSSCVAGGKLVASATAAGDGTYHPATSFVPSSAGTYWWFASYGGDPGDNAAASACGASMPKTVVVAVPVVRGFKQSHARWRQGSKLPSIASAHKLPVGTTFRFTVNQAVTVKLVFSQHGKLKGTLTMAAKAGKRAIKFQGRLSRSRRLKPGRYTVTITATNAAKVTSAPRKLSFTIVR
jgi:hypothetical protein